MRVVDLSHPVSDGMQVFPGDPEISSRLTADFSRDGFQVAELHLGTHSGTHIDAPLHVIPRGNPIDESDLSSLVAPARIVHVLDLGAGDVIGWRDVSAQLEDVAPRTIVLFRTDWSDRFGTGEYLRHPVLDAEIATRLVASGVRVIGVDTLNPDPTLHKNGVGPARLPVHDEVLGAGGAIIENLTYLRSVTWDEPLVCALPLRLRGMDGSPTRAVALEQ